MTTTPPAISSLPAPPNPADRSTFNTLAYPWSAALPAFGASVSAVADNVKLNADEAALSATAAAAQALAATLQANAAASSAITAGAVAWVSGTTYAIGNARFSPVNGQTYRRITSGAGTTDPSADGANWVIVNGLVNQSVSIPVNNLPAIRPSLDLDFANSQTVDPRITFTRSSAATVTNSKGLIAAVLSGVPRIDFNPVTLACKGLLIEEQRVRLNTISLLPAAAENVTVTAVAHTVSFYGTGTVVLSGAGSATIVGTGAYPARTTLTLTPTAGTLKLTPSGSVNDLQVEAGGFATSVIRGEGTQVTRAADVAIMTGANFSSWYRQDEGSFVVDAIGMPGSTMILTVSKGLGTYGGRIQYNSYAPTLNVINDSGSVDVAIASGTVVANGVQFKTAGAYKVNDAAISTNGSAISADSSCTLPTAMADLRIGSSSVGTNQGSVIKSITYYHKRLTNAELVALSTQ